MGDAPRKILYPLVLPCLVTAVWGFAWTKKYDDQLNTGAPIVTIPASGTPSVTTRYPEPQRVELRFAGRAPLEDGAEATETFVAVDYVQEE